MPGRRTAVRPAARPRVGRWSVALCVAIGVAALLPSPVLATNTLSQGSVTPGSGTTATVFVFRVRYDSTTPPRDATAVWAEVAGLTVPLALEPDGTATGGWYVGSGSLPQGTWPVTFRATAVQDAFVADADGGTVEVLPAGASPSPAATTSPTPIATAAPTPSAAPPTPGATPVPTLPVVPRPTAPPRTPSASASPTPSTSAVEPSIRPTPTEGGQRPSSVPTAIASSTARATAAPGAEPEEDPAGGALPWIVLGGGMATSGAAIIALQWLGWRRRQRA